MHVQAQHVESRDQGDLRRKLVQNMLDKQQDWIGDETPVLHSDQDDNIRFPPGAEGLKAQHRLEHIREGQ